MSYNSKYTGEQVEQLLDRVANGEAGGGGGGVTVETDPVFSASPAASITEAKKAEWDAKYSKPSGGIPASDLASDVFLQGEKGEKGDKGDKGDTGAAGTNGKDGADGATFTPSVDATGNLSWTNNKGLTNPPTVNIKGPKGDSGEGGGNNTYFTDFKVTDLELLVSGHLESLQIDGQGLMDAIYNGKTIFVPYGEDVIGGAAILLGEVADTETYLSIYTHVGDYIYAEAYNGVIYADSIIIRDLQAETVEQTQTNNITNIAIANAMCTTGGNIFALPSDATGDEDDILLSRDSVKTINGQSIVRDEEGDDIHTTYPRVLATSASVALQPNVVTVWPSAITSQELTLSFSEAPQGFSSEFVVMFSVGADGVQLIVPDNVVWADGILPAMTNGKTYEISFVDNLATFLEF